MDGRSRSLRMRMLFALQVVPCAISLLVCVVARGQQTTVYDVSGVRSQGGGAAIFDALADGWSQTKTYVDVSISAELASSSVGTSGTAYLTTRIGAGTSPADQIASTSFVFPPSFTQRLPLFSGLTLASGTYFLTVSVAPGSFAGWQYISPADATFATDTGMSLQPPPPRRGLFFAPSADAYPPASMFIIDEEKHPVFSVTAVPEPSSIVLLVACGALSCGRRRALLPSLC